MLTEGQRKVIEADLRFTKETLEDLQKQRQECDRAIPELEQRVKMLEKRLRENEEIN